MRAPRGAHGVGERLAIKPLTPDLWPDLVDLFGAVGACNGCWCMYPRIGTEYRKRPREKNRNEFREIVRRGPPPGLLAFSGDVAVGWCALTPRVDVPWFDRAWKLDGVDDTGVWSLSCFYIRKGYRGQGITKALIGAALAAARRAKARALEAYPFDADASPSASSTGYQSTFAHAGFKVIGHRRAVRPIMRFDLKPASRRASRAAGESPR